MSSPTARSLKYLRQKGYHATVVEYYNFFSKKRKDLFGFGDILAFRAQENGSLAIQCTTMSNASERRRKITEDVKVNVALRAWLKANNRFAFFFWRKLGAKGKRKLWEVYEENVALHDL